MERGGFNPDLRLEFDFLFTVAELKEACIKKASYHRGRASWWSRELESRKAALNAEAERTPGMDRRQLFSNTQRYVEEEDSKVRQHENQALEFDRWAFLWGRGNQDTRVRLRWHDCVYFGLGESAE